MVMTAMLGWSVFGFSNPTKACVKALGTTRGKPFTAGLVFIDGKYIEPPYVVERRGNVIRVNSKPVTGPIVAWDDFLRTQPGLKTTKTEVSLAANPAKPSTTAKPVEETKPVEVEKDDLSSLDDLFSDDEPQSAAVKPVPDNQPPVLPAGTTSSSKPSVKTVVSLTLEGDFVKNDKAKALLEKVNAQRTEIDRILRSGGFLCFGETYSRVVGDSASALKLLQTLPRLQRNATDLNSFRAAVRAAGLVYLNEELVSELYNNRVDYRKLQDRFKSMKKELEWQNMIDEASQPIF